jgi:hypothetical protein
MKRTKSNIITHPVYPITTQLMEVLLMKHFSFNSNHIVPGVLMNGGRRELDLLVVTNNGYAYEVEIKISKQDLLNDKKKKHNHGYDKLKNVWFAVSENIEIEFALKHIPEHAGLIWVYYDNFNFKYKCKVVKLPVNKKKPYKWSKEEIHDLLRLGTMRIYSLKKKNVQLMYELNRK